VYYVSGQGLQHCGEVLRTCGHPALVTRALKITRLALCVRDQRDRRELRSRLVLGRLRLHLAEAPAREHGSLHDGETGVVVAHPLGEVMDVPDRERDVRDVQLLCLTRSEEHTSELQ